MKKILFAAAGLVLLLGAFSFVGCSQGSPVLGDVVPEEIRLNMNSQQEGIWVNGTGEVMAAPDVANLRLGIEAQKATVSEAQSEAAAAMANVGAALEDNGVAEEDIQTQSFNIQKITRWDDDTKQEIVIGYRVTNIVAVKVREVDNVGSIIDAVAMVGGDYTRVDSINFTIEDPSAYQGEARMEAIADAEAKAEQMAELTGIDLGKPTYISESSYVPSPVSRVAYEMAAPTAVGAVETPISAGEMTITVNVQIAYAIQD